MKNRRLTYPRTLSCILSVLAPILSYYLLEVITHNPFEIPFRFQLLGWVCCFLISGLLFFLTGRMNLSLILTALFTALLGTANYFVLAFRGSPILPWDLASAGTALSVADHFTFSVSLRLGLVLAAYVLLMLLCLPVQIRLKDRKVLRLSGLGSVIVLAAVYVLCLQNESIDAWLDVYEMPFTQDYVYEQNGFFVSFLVNTKYMKVETPDGYSPEEADRILAGEQDSGLSLSENDRTLNRADGSGTSGTDEDQELPNIIVIMNEAFSDLSVIGDFQASEDYMPYFRSLYGAEDTISGSLYVSVLGGNTANTEFEFLTGDTMAFLPTGSIPYQQFLSEELPALPEILTQQGYTATGIHPYIADGWRRNEVYPLLGFEEAFFRDDFDDPDKLRGYITDEAAFEKVIETYEEKDGEGPFFSFLVTMQNHGGYSQQWADFQRTVTVEGMDGLDLTRTNAYLTLIKETDRAFEELISYFEQTDEKTIILMFGDHQPNVETAFLEQLYGKDYDSLTAEELSQRYRTPFVLWANYDIEEDEDVQISANYLSCLLMEAAGLEMSSYQEYLWEMYQELPVITANFAIDSDGRFYSADQYDQLEELLNGYEIVQYNHLFDTENRKDENYLVSRDSR